ncbi:MAG: DNA polymerase I [Clostridiales bacterium]|nr:DNA polymerase I [Clostridiales bacterium]
MKLLVIDGNSILNRAFYGIKLLTTKDGQFTNGIYGFMNILLKLQEEYSPDATAIAFDLKAPTFRHKLYDEYKAQRKGMPPELAQQMPILKELLTALGYTIVEKEGYEADDILGTLSASCKGEDFCYIATGDRDSLQLVNDNTNVLLASTKAGKPQTIQYDTKKIKEEYGVTPKQLIEIKALMGDSSDNIPGVAGVGQKTASDLIQRFSDIDNIYNNIDTLDIKTGVKNKLINDKDKAYLSHELGTIFLEVPVDTDLQSYIKADADDEKSLEILASLEMFSTMERLGLNANATFENLENAKKMSLEKTSDYNKLYNIIKQSSKAYFITEYENLQIRDMFFCTDEKVINVSNTDLEFLPFVSKFLGDEGIEKYTSDSKELFRFCIDNDIDIKNIKMDTSLAGYVLNPSANSYDVTRLAQEYNIPQINIDTENEVAQQASVLIPLCDKLDFEIEQNNQQSLLRDIEIPLALVLASMEKTGFEVDAKGIEDFGTDLAKKIEEIEKRIYSEVGYEFNLNSPKQLGVALFEDLGLPVQKKTKTGYSTSADVLESLAHMHPVVEDVLQYRTLAKLKSTYCDGLLKVIAQDGRIHSTLNQTETRTGRISSTEPNLQNIPVRSELGRELRKFFRAKEGYVLIDADYSQIELRVLADISNDPVMINAFLEEDDIHTITASQVFNLPVSMVTPLMRSRAKAVNFGIVYGIGAFSLAKDIGVTRKEADTYIKGYLEHYSGVREYMDKVVHDAKDTGYVTTLFNRRRYLPELTASNAMLRAFGERVARNMPIQGTAADIIKIAMVRVYARLKNEGMKSRLILQVHDELIVEAPINESERAAQILKEEMENACKLKVPLTVDVNCDKTWYDAKG